jgi:hypothetical protein
LLPYADGISARRGSFQAVAQLPIPIVSTISERSDEFDLSPLLASKVHTQATVLCPAGAAPHVFAEAVLKAHTHRQDAKGVDLSGLWQEAADKHLLVYERLLQQRLGPERRAISLPAE